MNDIERRVTQGQIEVREAEGDDAGLSIEGFAARFDQPSELLWDWGGSFRETIAPGAFAETVKQDDIRLLFDHDGIPLARNTAGTLDVHETSTGLKVSADLDERSPHVQSVASAMRRGDLNQMSFGFEVIDEEWSPDFAFRRLKKVRLWDVSIVTYPAYPQTSVKVRSLLEAHKQQASRDVIQRRHALRRYALENDRYAVI